MVGPLNDKVTNKKVSLYAVFSLITSSAEDGKTEIQVK